jgi:hypothetical protein
VPNAQKKPLARKASAKRESAAPQNIVFELFQTNKKINDHKTPLGKTASAKSKRAAPRFRNMLKCRCKREQAKVANAARKGQTQKERATLIPNQNRQILLNPKGQR